MAENKKDRRGEHIVQPAEVDETFFGRRVGDRECALLHGHIDRCIATLKKRLDNLEDGSVTKYTASLVTQIAMGSIAAAVIVFLGWNTYIVSVNSRQNDLIRQDMQKVIMSVEGAEKKFDNYIVEQGRIRTIQNIVVKEKDQTHKEILRLGLEIERLKVKVENGIKSPVGTRGN